MRTRFLFVVAALLLLLLPSAVSAQYAPILPPGIISIEVDGQAINSIAVPTTNSSAPEISGRVDESLLGLELAVVDGDILRFPVTVGGAGRFRTVPPAELPDGFYFLYANDLLVGSFQIVSGSTVPRLPGELLDIARVVPYPADAAQSLPTLGVLEGRYFSLSEEARRTAERNPGGPGAQEIERQLAVAGWLQRYENRLAVPNPDDPAIFDVQLSSFVVEYASGADARIAFDSLRSADAAEFLTIGDESQLVLTSGETPDTGVAYQAARLVSRVGPLLVVIVYADLRNEAPNLALLESIGTVVAARGSLVADRQVIPLGSMAIRPNLAGASDEVDVVARAFYENRGGALTAIFGEDELVRANRAAMLADTTDAFTASVQGTFESGGNDRPPRQQGGNEESPIPDQSAVPASVRLRTSLYAFPTELEADTWIAGQENALSTTADASTTFAPFSDAPALADAAAVFSMVTTLPDGTELEGYRVFARTGSIVAILDVQSDPAVSLRGAIGLMEDQLACIAAQGCAGLTPLPGSIFGNRDRPAG